MLLALAMQGDADDAGVHWTLEQILGTCANISRSEALRLPHSPNVHRRPRPPSAPAVPPYHSTR